MKKKKCSCGVETASKAEAGKRVVKAYRGYTFREKLLPSVLLSLLAPFTVFFFGPFEAFGNNVSQFKFLLGDFLPLCLFSAVVVSLLFFGLLLLLRSCAFDIAFGILFGLSLKYRCQKRCTGENPRFPWVFFIFLAFSRFFKNRIESDIPLLEEMVEYGMVGCRAVEFYKKILEN